MGDPSGALEAVWNGGDGVWERIGTYRAQPRSQFRSRWAFGPGTADYRQQGRGWLKQPRIKRSVELDARRLARPVRGRLLGVMRRGKRRGIPRFDPMESPGRSRGERETLWGEIPRSRFSSKLVRSGSPLQIHPAGFGPVLGRDRFV